MRVLQKFHFVILAIPVWNNVSNDVVSAYTLSTFKRRLKFWSDQHILYNGKPEIYGIGNCSRLSLVFCV